MGIFEPVLTMINAYNKAISEKANDVDYFADAYLKVLVPSWKKTMWRISGMTESLISTGTRTVDCRISSETGW